MKKIIQILAGLGLVDMITFILVNLGIIHGFNLWIIDVFGLFLGIIFAIFYKI